jgi:hypothetical protein
LSRIPSPDHRGRHAPRRAGLPQDARPIDHLLTRFDLAPPFPAAPEVANEPEPEAAPGDPPLLFTEAELAQACMRTAERATSRAEAELEARHEHALAAERAIAEAAIAELGQAQDRAMLLVREQACRLIDAACRRVLGALWPDHLGIVLNESLTALLEERAIERLHVSAPAACAERLHELLAPIAATHGAALVLDERADAEAAGPITIDWGNGWTELDLAHWLDRLTADLAAHLGTATEAYQAG